MARKGPKKTTDKDIEMRKWAVERSVSAVGKMTSTTDAEVAIGIAKQLVEYTETGEVKTGDDDGKG